MHIRKTFLVVALTMFAMQQANAGVKEYFTHEHATANLTIDGVAWDGFVLPFADEQITKLAPNTALIGSIGVQHVAKLLTRAALNAARAQVFGNGESKEAFVNTLVGELGYAGAKELLHQIGLDIDLGASKGAFDTCAAPYLKRVLAVALLDLLPYNLLSN